MDRRSPSNSLPPQVSRRRSPTYPGPRDHRGGRSYRSPPRDNRSPHRFLKRSPSPRPCKSGRSPSKEVSLKRNRRAASPARPTLKAFDFEADDDEARQTFCCVHCNVKLHDLISMESHLSGRPHLMQQQRLKDNQLRIATGHGLKARHPPGLGQVEYDSSAQRKLKPEQERWLDENSRDKIKPKFQGDRFHCDVCDVWVKTRDQMQAHKEGMKHKKKSDKVVRHHCPICLIDVTCKDTLENHMKGRDHIKRVQQLADRRRMGQRSSMDEDIVIEKENDSKSKEEYREEVTNLKKQLKILQSKVKELQEYKKFCLDTYENKDFKKLLEHERQRVENHQRPIELNKPGIYCKQERDTSPHEPTCRRAVKKLKRRSYHESDEDEDRKRSFKSEWRLDEGGRDIKSEECGRRLDEGKQDIKLNRRSGEGGRGSFKSQRRSDGNGSWHTPNESIEATDGRMEYIENEIDENLKVESDYSEKHEYVESESKLKNELNFDDDIILVE